ncbi:MAG: hypothetical protein KatS3mg033_2420 [Thermonema sp.]|uniref:porin family protein n=1 Tax=Thermonema sp. TaxID=2231181 RepID=UPI0021DC3AD6|nr:porin family protein [Thermonema sp.]GIV40620.1 MAG: hypothetical protein KatS3mg033_2420 [Thermonema sp.]
MKKWMMMAVIALFAHSAWAQSYSFGIRTGINANKLVPSSDDLKNDGYKYGFVGGAFLRLGIGDWFVQPELLISQKGANMKGSGNFSNIETVKRNINSLDVPILLGRRFLGGVMRINAGPVLSFPYSAKEEVTDSNGQTTTTDYEVKNSTIGYQAGVGFDFGKFTIDARYEGSLSKLGKDSYQVFNRTFEADDRVSTFQFTIGFKIIGE